MLDSDVDRPSGAVRLQDVARAAGVSLTTASYVINKPDRVGKGTRERVLATIAELQFVPNEAARKLRMGASFIPGARRDQADL